MNGPRRDPAYQTILDATNRLDAIRQSSDEALIAALVAAARAHDGLLAALLAEETTSRMRRVRTLASKLPEGILVLDPDARISYLNEGAARLFGISRAEARGQSPMDLIDRLDADGNVMPRDEWTAARSLALGRVLHDEAWFRRRSDGALFSSAFVLTPLVNESSVIGAVGLFSDTTLQKTKADEAAVELKALAAIARGTPDMLTRAEPDGRVFWASPSAFAVVGHTPAELVGLTVADLAHPGDVPHVEQVLRIASEPNMPPMEVIFRIRHKHGGDVWVHARFQAVTDAQTGGLQELVASMRPLHPRSPTPAGNHAVSLSRHERP